MRRTISFGLGIVVGAVLAFASAVFTAAATVVDPMFWWFMGAVAAGGAVIIGWAWRDLHSVDQAMQSMEETVLLDVEAIANYRPPPRHPMDLRLWRRVRGRASRVKEGVS